MFSLPLNVNMSLNCHLTDNFFRTCIKGDPGTRAFLNRLRRLIWIVYFGLCTLEYEVLDPYEVTPCQDINRSPIVPIPAPSQWDSHLVNV